MRRRPALILPDSTEARARAAAVVSAGGVVAFRTDTFYGLGADPFNVGALRLLNALKGREGKPVLVVISDHVQAERFVETRTNLFDALAAAHWPGALTLVAEARREVSGELTAGTGKVGVRLPGDEAVREFVRACGGALTATSANTAGGPPARSASEVESYFHSQIPLIVDGGEASSDRPSTVVDVAGRSARLIREGVVSREELVLTLQTVGATFD